MQKTIQVLMPDVLVPRWNTTLALSMEDRQRDSDHLLSTFGPEVSSFPPSDLNTIEQDVANQTEYKVAKLVWQVCPVVLFLFGTFGNVLILFMMRTLRLGRTSMHIYLRALAISDLCVLYTGLLRWWIRWTFDIDLRDKHNFLCKAHTWLVYVAIYVSAWLLVVMTLERACSTCVPHRVGSFCTKRRAFMVIVFIVLSQVLMQGHFLVGLALVDNGSNATHCSSVTADYDIFAHKVYPIIDMVLLSLVPFLFVILGNAVIVWKTFLSLKTAAELNLTSGKNALLRRRRASSMTVILLGLSAIFLLTTSPTCVYNIWEQAGGAKEAKTTPQKYARAELAWAVVNIAMYCNNTFNFYLYCLSGRKFRNEMRRQFSRRRNDSQSNALSAPSVQVHRFPLNDYRSKCLTDQTTPNGQLSYQSSFYARSSNAYL
ncbi:unnamed protein product [Lymnaea stagnalis]|uniref:G-protein coupled receptors family 1 profile domain-containing protein n=1 Tax=Lymnaea stagnalis TaxID=6523 RepID=A0AAV2H6N8_LYMST